MRTHTRPILTTLALILMAGCAGGPGGPENPYAAAGGQRDLIQIDVLNNNFSDATLWAVVQDSRRVRLGQVTGKTEARFSLPWRFSEDLRIEIDMLAGPRCLTERIPVDPGDILQLEIQAVFQETRYCQRN